MPELFIFLEQSSLGRPPRLEGLLAVGEGPLALALDQRHVLGRRLLPTRRSRRHDMEKLVVRDA